MKEDRNGKFVTPLRVAIDGRIFFLNYDSEGQIRVNIINDTKIESHQVSFGYESGGKMDDADFM